MKFVGRNLCPRRRPQRRQAGVPKVRTLVGPLRALYCWLSPIGVASRLVPAKGLKSCIWYSYSRGIQDAQDAAAPKFDDFAIVPCSVWVVQM